MSHLSGIDGLRSGEVALYIKVHHARLDGQAGIALARALFDTEVSGRRIKSPRAVALNLVESHAETRPRKRTAQTG